MLTTLRKIFGLNTEQEEVQQEERFVTVTQTDKFGDTHSFNFPESSAYLTTVLLLKENIKSLEEELAYYKLRDLAAKEPQSDTDKDQTHVAGESPIVLLENQSSDDTHQGE